MKKICTLCAALLVTLSLAACASGPNAAEQVIGTEGTVAMEDLTPSSDADKEAIGYQLEAPEAGEEICVLKTNYGDIKLRFFPDAAPKAVYNFKSLALSGYYDGLTFHRVIDDFMIQGGDPEGTGAGGQSIWGEDFEDEFHTNLLNITGAVSCANRGANTNGSQFFINAVEPVTIDWSQYETLYSYYETAPDQFTAMYGGTLDMDISVTGRIQVPVRRERRKPASGRRLLYGGHRAHGVRAGLRGDGRCAGDYAGRNG